MGHRPGEAKRQADGTDTLSEAKVLVPAVLRKRFACGQVEPHGSHKGWNGVMSKKVMGESGELWPKFLSCREPRFDWPQPVGVVQGHAHQSGVEGSAVVPRTLGSAQQSGLALHLPQQSLVSQQRPVVTSG